MQDNMTNRFYYSFHQKKAMLKIFIRATNKLLSNINISCHKKHKDDK